MIPQLNEPMAQHNMLMGRRLYVIDEEREWARRLIDRLGLTGEASSSPTVWQMGLRRLHSRPLSLSLTGVALKTMMLHRPGHLWNFVRSCSGRWWSCSLWPCPKAALWRPSSLASCPKWRWEKEGGRMRLRPNARRKPSNVDGSRGFGCKFF